MRKSQIPGLDGWGTKRPAAASSGNYSEYANLQNHLKQRHKHLCQM